MTSYDFEKTAKTMVIVVMKDHFNTEMRIEEINLVWFSHLLGGKKCMLYSPKMGNRYAEVTYNVNKDEMYVDIYTKEMNVCFSSDQIDEIKV